MGKRHLGCLAALLTVVATVAPASRAAEMEAWVQFDAGIFKFMAPASLEQIRVQPIDSIVGSYESEHFGLQFDYGPYGGRFTDEALKNRNFIDRPKVEHLLIDGRQAVIVTAHTDGSGNCSVTSETYITGPRREEDLFLTGCGDEQGGEALNRIYRSIRFAPPTGNRRY